MNRVEVLLPLPFAHGFDYLASLEMALAPGDYVRVPFGRKELVGIVWGKARGDVAEAKLKPVIEKIEDVPPMTEVMRRYLEWVAWYNLAPLGLVLKMALFNLRSEASPPGAAQAARLNGASPRVRSSRKTTPPEEFSFHPVPLSTKQEEAAETLAATLGQGYRVTVLDGVTGSGKTEVYFDSIARAMQALGIRHLALGTPDNPNPQSPMPNAQILVLLPEIALSVQWLERFRERFGAMPEVWHSDIAPSKKRRSWKRIASGEARLVVGARSALFLPFRNLQLIVVDEEHEASYKQEDGVVYQARDMAVARAHAEKIPIILASATPSLETLYNIRQNKFHHLSLPHRHAEAKLPEIRVIDMRAEVNDAGQFISHSLRRALAETVASGQQAMLFLNRRGYAPLLLCRACGYRFQCEWCQSWLVYHKAKARLACHHCGHTVKLPPACPSCNEKDSFHACGPGVERLQEEVREALPDARIAVMTSDHIPTAKLAQAMIEEIEKGRIDIVIGTQMIAKGHHFPKLTLVGIVDADLGLAGGDLRAAERTYQLLHQVSGRAGREELPGRVMLQSYLPDHPVMKALVAGDRDGFLGLELKYREESAMPPFGRLAALIIEGSNEREVAEYARALAAHAPVQQGRRSEGTTPQGGAGGSVSPQIYILGPAPAPLARLRGKVRYRLLVKASRKIALQATLSRWLGECPTPSSLRLKVDIDPYSFL